MTGIKLEDLSYGALNEIADLKQSQLTGDPRRTSTSTSLQRGTAQAYEPNTLKNRSEFNGFVVASRAVTYPVYQNKASMFREYLFGGSDNESAQQAHTAYKVYIPELEPRPAPKGNTDPILRTYPDVYSELSTSEAIPMGSLVLVRYENPATLSNPKIVKVLSKVSGIEGLGAAGSGKEAGAGDEAEGLTSRFFNRAKSFIGITNQRTPPPEQEITGIPNIKKSTTNINSDKYTHWGTDPAMKKLLVALNAGAEQEGVTLIITSALRTPYNQVRIMFQNYKKKGGLTDRAKGRKYLVDLYNDAAANAIVDAFERGNYTDEKAAGAGAGHLAAPDSVYFHISKHQLGKAADVAFLSSPNPDEKVSKALLAAAKANKGINILMESDHFHVSFEGESTPSKFRRMSGRGGPTSAQVASVAESGLTVGTIG